MATIVKIITFLLILAVGLLFWLNLINRVSAHHNIYLPLVPNTPLIQNLIADQEQRWCANSAAANYPSFISQLQDVNDQYSSRVGIKHIRIDGIYQTWTDAKNAGCDIWHQGRYDSFCSGCAANVYYANSRPVTVNYKLSLGYVDWRSAQGHELGHALLGLHEQYIDLGSIGCTARTDTVMDCASGVRYPTRLDVTRSCAVIDPDPADTFFGSFGCAQEPPPDFSRVAHSLPWTYVNWLEGRGVHPYDAPILIYLVGSSPCGGVQVDPPRLAHSLHYAYTAFNSLKPIHPFDKQTIACILGRP